MKLEDYFSEYRTQIVGENKYINNTRIVYADWAGSGRFYRKIEEEIIEKYAPLYGNVHSEDTYIGKFIGNSYEKSKDIISNHFGADKSYSIISAGFGMTAAIFKLQDILLQNYKNDQNRLPPVVFLTIYEHNSNYLSWINRGCECVVIDNDEFGQPDINCLGNKLEEFKERKFKIASFSACSNVTGIIINLKPLINKVKQYNCIVCIDYTTITPYKDINIAEYNNEIDALVFSGHKLLGGVGGSGILIIKKSIYECIIPTKVGGGVVKWVNPGEEIIYTDKIDEREEAGTPGIVQTIKTSLALNLKRNMNKEVLDLREKEIVAYMIDELSIEGIKLYDNKIKNRIGILSFNTNKYFGEVVQKLSDEYGIQARGGCCCASIYAHKLLGIDKEKSSEIIRSNKYKELKPGFVRISTSPVMSNNDIEYICSAIKKIVK